MKLADKECRREDFIIITGGPGAGKTTLLDEMHKNGYKYVAEVARDIIQTQVSTKGDALPWADTEKYRDLMLDKSLESYFSAPSNSSKRILFFDRGIPDVLAYSNLINLVVTKKLELATRKYRYNPHVFILPPWQEIYKTDNERVQDFAEAVKTYKFISETYEKLGYKLIVVPRMGVKQRIDFILKRISCLLKTRRD
ncbi:AAA family ATPase [Shimazuella alba]|uniref:AAA family ATPase n=1 Tax=Shimazuella alba TaxID=2690964 RepID=A0A6I4VLQ4_9BACL|nr:AAA family ATPase [Shimazuella alba]MXQ52337.1 AAA family ATPase [Shimazuella alba]